MMSITLTVLENTRRYTILPTLTIAGSTRVSLTKRVKRLIGSDVFRELTKAVKNSIKHEVSEALTTENLTVIFPQLTEKFWLRLALPMLEVNQKLSSLRAGKLSEIKKLEEDITHEVAKLLRCSGYKYSEDLVYGLSAMVDYDMWLLEKVSELDFEGLVKRLWERALEEMLQLSGYLRYLFFAWTSATSAIHRILL